MPTVELPAHNLTLLGGPGNEAGVTLTGGPEALSDRTNGEFVVFEQTSAIWEPSIRIGYDDAGTGLLGFGLFDLPAGATVTECRFVAEGYVDDLSQGPSIPVDEADFEANVGPINMSGSGVTNPPVVNTPMLLIRYSGDAFFFGGYNISTFPDGAPGDAECAVDLEHLIGGDDYVFAGVGSPDTGTDGLRVGVYIPAYPWPVGSTPYGVQRIVLTYLAIRITYTAGIPPRRIFGRSDGRTQGAKRVLGGGNTRQSGSRTLGSVL